MAYVRTVKTSSGATAVQIVWSSRRGSRSIEHLGSARDEARLAALRAAADERLAAGQAELDLGVAGRPWSDAVADHLLACGALCGMRLCRGYDVLGFDEAAGGDDVFRQLVLARIIEPTSKADSLRVLSRDRCGACVVSDAESPATRVRQTQLPASTFVGMRRLMPHWVRRLWCSMTSPRCTSKPTPVTGFVSPGFSRNAAWSRRSPSGC